MTHKSENAKRLSIKIININNEIDLTSVSQNYNDVCVLVLPATDITNYGEPLEAIGVLLSNIAKNLGPNAVLITIGEDVDLVNAHENISLYAKYQEYIAIKRKTTLRDNDLKRIPINHFGALIHSKYNSALRHTKTRLEYTYCPYCDKTTKDYGGKKHTYHEYGTLISDVWRDIPCDLDGDISIIFERFSDFFGQEPYHELLVLDCRSIKMKRIKNTNDDYSNMDSLNPQDDLINKLIQGDCIEELRKIPDNSIDFIFADPPYNLKKKYSGYDDDLLVTSYFNWCDEWLSELLRVLRPGRTLTLLNIPICSIRHFLYLEKNSSFQNWIVWEALSLPVRMIMPAHYTILCFTKGESRPLPGLVNNNDTDNTISSLVYDSLNPLADGYCLRAKCVNLRRKTGTNDRGPLTDLWSDIHRLKHNTRRVDHPTQLPPQLMYRLISLFTYPGELVLDCFNGAGTTSLTADQLGRKYIGIEKSEKYYNMALARHDEIKKGLDPFRKEDRVLTSKNSRVPRMPKTKYDISKKTLQLEAKRVASLIGRKPTRDDLIKYGKYPIKYYDEYFVSWGEVCAAARTTGMSEVRNGKGKIIKQQLLSNIHDNIKSNS